MCGGPLCLVSLLLVLVPRITFGISLTEEVFENEKVISGENEKIINALKHRRSKSESSSEELGRVNTFLAVGEQPRTIEETALGATSKETSSRLQGTSEQEHAASEQQDAAGEQGDAAGEQGDAAGEQGDAASEQEQLEDATKVNNTDSS